MSEQKLSSRQVWWLCASVIIVIAPHTLFLHPAISIYATLAVGLRCALAWQGLRLPPRAVLLPLAILAMLLVWFTVGRLLGREAGLSVLAALLPLKLLETQDTRHARAVLMLACFMLCGLFFYEQGPLTAALGFAGLLVVLASFAQIQRDQPWQARNLRTPVLLVLQGLPLLVVLFVLFPRFENPLWGLPLDRRSGITGLSDRMTPGSISQLILDGTIAFRVEFGGPVPPPRDRYWRGPVLTQFDGREWRARPASSFESPRYQPSGTAYDYSITLEPHGEQWLLALDYPAAGSSMGMYTGDFGLRRIRPITQRVRYSLRSQPGVPTEQVAAQFELRAATQQPKIFNPRTQALGAQIASETATDAERLQRILAFMRRAGLIYTLEPALTGEHGADDFLFETREGFCEHFSSAFVLLARAAGIPARVVTGYQGGEFNPIDGALVVRQSDAHAWAEIWLDGRGWVRVDPTAASFPTRIESGLREALGEEALPFVLRSDLHWLLNLRHRWEAIGNIWNQWVLGYNASRQRELLQRLGFPDVDWRDLIRWLTGLAAAWLLWMLWLYWPRTLRRDPLDRVWQAACRRLAKHGLPRHPWEAPGDYANRIISLQPGLLSLRTLSDTYGTLRYGRRPPEAADIAKLQAIVREIGRQLK